MHTDRVSVALDSGNRLTKVVIENFKKFSRAEIELGREPTIFVGQNNGGKTTALQAINLWGFLANRWHAERGSSRATKRTGLPITRNTIYAAPIGDVRKLWNGARVQDQDSQKIKVRITAFGINEDGEWEYGMEGTYQNSELLHARPVDASRCMPREVREIFHLPPLSGVQTNERKLEEAARNQAIGEGRPGEVLRNLLLEVQTRFPDAWEELKTGARNLFHVELHDISFNPVTDPFIEVNYTPISPGDSHSRIVFEIVSSGSGFLQYLLLAAFMYSHNRGAILLLDEPDSHMHTFLQRNMYDWLQDIASKTGAQLIISTHSEILVNSTGSIDQIVTFFGEEPRRFSCSDKRILNNALQIVSPLSIVNAEWSGKVLLAEGDTDFRILVAFSEVLDHPVLPFFRDQSLLFRPFKTREIGAAMKYFTTLQSVVSRELKGFCLRDSLLITERTQEPPFQVEYWNRAEIENYMIHPDALLRYYETRGIGGLFAQRETAPASEYLSQHLPRAVLENPLIEDIGYKGSDFLENFFATLGVPIRKGSYWEIIKYMRVNEVHADVVEMLDKIHVFLRDSG
ncbi:MAG: ATP-binding protein [Candidatus Moranbacteria bacterium]|nr:ATP-binding protein [Candidatus Moranbacteria bacterium]